MILIYFILTLAILVTIHEYGHYWVARRNGVRVLTFSVGFGPTLWRRKDRHGTDWVIAALPLGGFVRMLDEREAAVAAADRPYSFNSKSKSARAAIVSAGPIANFLLAVLVYWLVAIIGVPGLKPVVGDIDIDSPAYHAGFESGQTILAVDGQPTPSQYRLHMALVKRIGDTGEINFDLQYRDSGLVYRVAIPIERWLSEQDRPEFYSSLGFNYFMPDAAAIIHAVNEGPAQLAGLQAGDEIIAIDDVAISSWRGAVAQLQQKPGQQIELRYLRGEQQFSATLTTLSVEQPDGTRQGMIGVAAQAAQYPEHMRVIERYSPIDAIGQGLDKTGEMIVFTLSSIKKMLVGLISTSSLSGPITIAKVAGASANAGLVPYLEFLALLSVSLGVLNLLPIPVLDGGHLLFIAGEAITRKPVPEKLQIWGQQLGLLLILSIMALALFNDLTHF